jgi:PPOX class probable F420-dependent enzyme
VGRAMDDDRRRTFLAHGTRTAKLATTRADGRPHVAPVWFVLDGDDLVLTTAATSAKGRTLARDPRVALVVDDDTPPFAFVLVEGTAELSTDPEELLRWATRIGARYMGEDRAEEFGRRNGVAGELLVRIHPTRFVTEDDVTG